MALNIKDPTADRLARDLAAMTGETITTAVTVAIRERLERVARVAPPEVRLQAIMRISDRAAADRVVDDRTDEEILGYDDDGLPT